VLLATEVGDELEGAAESGDEVVEDVLSGCVAALYLESWTTGMAVPVTHAATALNRECRR